MLAQQGKHGESLLPLTRLFHPGQLVRCIVTDLRTGAAAELEPRAPAGQKRKRRAPQKLIELSLEVARVCAAVAAEGLREGMALPACVRSVEDHGYTLLLGPQGAEGECASLPRPMLHLHPSVLRWCSAAEGACSSGSGACRNCSTPTDGCTPSAEAHAIPGPQGVHLCSRPPSSLPCLEHDVDMPDAPWHQPLPQKDLHSEGRRQAVVLPVAPAAVFPRERMRQLMGRRLCLRYPLSRGRVLKTPAQLFISPAAGLTWKE